VVTVVVAVFVVALVIEILVDDTGGDGFVAVFVVGGKAFVVVTVFEVLVDDTVCDGFVAVFVVGGKAFVVVTVFWVGFVVVI